MELDLEWRNLRDKLDYATRTPPSELFRRQVMATFEEETLAPLPEADCRKIAATNCARLYGFAC